jgi:hypothetical protein
MAKKKQNAQRQLQNKVLRNIIWFATAAFVIKLIAQFNIQGGAWLGADGENYVQGVNGLIKDGLFSKENHLLMWPAGYPLLMLIIAKIYLSATLAITAFLQSALYSFSVYYFAKELIKTKLGRYSTWIAFLLLFNPTLSLSSLAIGYESAIASGHLLIVALWLKWRHKNTESSGRQEILLSSLVAGFMVFMQPRLITTILIFVLIWFFTTTNKKVTLVSIAIGMLIVIIFPLGLMERNKQANGLNSISTNLGYTMNIGYGDTATGGYANGAKGVPCAVTAKDPAGIDNQKVGCVLSWVASHPTKTIGLFVKKAFYFWSPWSGPVANGTMARNPWLKVNPVSNIAKSKDGFSFIYGSVGKVVGWIWLLLGMAFFGVGGVCLWKLGGTEKLLGIAMGSGVLVQMLISMATIGDHRFRLPTMPYSLVLQLAGLLFLLRKLPARQN